MVKFRTDFVENETGIFIGVPSEIYHKAPGESNSSLKLLQRSPKDYKRIKDGADRVVTDAMEYGTLFHAAVLENRTLDEMVHVRPETYGENKPWHGGANECKKWLAAHEDKPVLTAAEFKLLKEEVDYVKHHPLVQYPLLGAYSEVSLFARAEETGYLLKCRTDALKYTPMNGQDAWLITDVKTCLDGTTEAFAREILKRKYHVQAAMYRRIVRKLTKCQDVKFCFIIVEKGRFMKVNVRFLSAQAMDLGDKVIDDYLAILRRCRVGNVWPEWSDQEEGIGYIDLPDFVYEDVDVLTGMTETTETT